MENFILNLFFTEYFRNILSVDDLERCLTSYRFLSIENLKDYRYEGDVKMGKIEDLKPPLSPTSQGKLHWRLLNSVRSNFFRIFPFHNKINSHTSLQLHFTLFPNISFHLISFELKIFVCLPAEFILDCFHSNLWPFNYFLPVAATTVPMTATVYVSQVIDFATPTVTVRETDSRPGEAIIVVQLSKMRFIEE